MTRFIIHIGPHKTGSTYLQNHLTANRAALIGRGIYYPREWTTPEIRWCHAELATLLQQASFEPIEQTFAGLKAAGWPVILLSSEDLSSLGEDPLRFLRDCTGSDAEIIFFTRRWSELLASHSQEHIRQGGTKLLPEFIAPILGNPFSSEIVNFSLVLDRFANVFELSRVKVFSYSNILKRGENLFSYFAANVLNVSDLPIISQTRAHASLSIENIELVRLLNVLRARHSTEIPWPMGRIVAAVSEYPLPRTRAAMAESVSEIPFSEFVQPFRAIYDWLVTKYESIADKQAADADQVLFEQQMTRLRYVDPRYLLDPTVLSEVLDFFSELAGVEQAEPQTHQPQPDDLSPIAGSIEFSGAGNSGSYCLTGWSPPEEGWRWATGPESHMLVPRPDVLGDCLLTIKLRPFLAEPQLPRQRMAIEVNGALLASFDADMTEPSVKSLTIPADVIGKGPELAITFRTPDAARPVDFGRPDTRRLSFAFYTLALAPAVNNCPEDSNKGAQAVASTLAPLEA